MDNVPFDSKDLSMLLAIKSFMTPQGQKAIDGLISILEVLSMPATEGREKPDTQAVTNLIRLLSNEE